MKTPTTSTVDKLLNRFDKELRKLLLTDLSANRNTKANLVSAIQNKLTPSLKAA
ncbi:hypothetical protein [Mucilaginibacter myungsuensis]|uniref:Uncharacterized protein n=1 Tax=Mucilaginibacter myungsuensis TaxID=649104 RepID=A0A929L0X2_9SPHI|nr:hypothetical protein [Mucilaginibacter myungsuensis]MBE9664210.1 hypothetical protein [Mucilaginibacter myungsuensis]MDN3599912.1 hypothetical protein [Mucilaginibacter myungsuensis]